MKIAHVSDIHYCGHGGNKKVLDALFRDLLANKPFDLIVFTGDLSSKGDVSKGNVGGLCEILTALKEHAGCHILLFPGNHDINLKERKSIYAPYLLILRIQTQQKNCLIKFLLERLKAC